MTNLLGGYMSKNSWIRKKLSELKDKRKVLELYEQFVLETNSKMTKRSFERQLYKVRPLQESGRASFEETGNYGVAEATRVKTLDDLIQVCKIDLDVWNIDRHVINKWETGLDQVALFQVKAWLSKKVLNKTQFEPLKRIEITPQKIDLAMGEKRKAKVALVLADAQMGYSRDQQTGRLIPFHDRNVWDTALQIAYEIRPDLIVYNGDMFDLTNWSSKFLHYPSNDQTLLPAMIELAWWDAEMRFLFPYAARKFIPGNHEDRLIKAIVVNQAQAYGLKCVDNLEGYDVLSIPNLMGMDISGLEYLGDYPNGQYWLNEDVRISHGETIRSGGGKTVAAIVRDAVHSEIVGHIHRVEYAAKTKDVHNGRRIVFATSFGTMAHIDGRVPASKGDIDWQQGIGVVYWTKDSCTSYSVPISDNAAIFNGKVFKGKDRGKQIAKDTGWRTLE